MEVIGDRVWGWGFGAGVGLNCPYRHIGDTLFRNDFVTHVSGMDKPKEGRGCIVPRVGRSCPQVRLNRTLKEDYKA